MQQDFATLKMQTSSYPQVNQSLQAYINQHILPQYTKNDRAHGIIHIQEVIRRSFVLNSEFQLRLNPDLIFTIAAYHDLGKHIDSDRHEYISAQLFLADENVKHFFTTNECQTIAKAIEDHRSSKSDLPRSTYGKLISSADRNTRIEIVFIRSFFVGKERQPNSTIHDYLDYTFKRLTKRYSLDDPENMFFADREYHTFLHSMRQLLKDEITFKKLYCTINQISSRDHKLSDEPGIDTFPNPKTLPKY